MAFQRRYQAEEVQQFAEKVKGDSLYLKGAEIGENGVRVRFLPWIYKGAPIDVLMLHQGWVPVVDPKTKKPDLKKSTPIRFDYDEEIPEDIQWAIGTGEYNKGKAQTPKPAIAGIVWIPKAHAIKVVELTQQGLVKPIIDMMNPDHEMFVNNLTEVELILSKKESNGRTEYKVAPAPNYERVIPEDAYLAMKDFAFSFEAFMQGGNPVEDKVAIKFEDIENDLSDFFAAGVGSGQKSSGSKVTTKPAEKQSSMNVDWKSFKTATGRTLGEFTIDELEAAKQKLIDTNKTGGKAYECVMAGLAELQNMGDDEGAI